MIAYIFKIMVFTNVKSLFFYIKLNVFINLFNFTPLLFRSHCATDKYFWAA